MTVGELLEKYYPFVIIGVILHFAIARPLNKYQLRKDFECRFNRKLEKIKWYQWFL